MKTIRTFVLMWSNTSSTPIMRRLKYIERETFDALTSEHGKPKCKLMNWDSFEK